MTSSPGATWPESTAWRQGSVLTEEAARDLGLLDETPGETTVAVVISHDCDLACPDLDAEPQVEILVGRLVERADGNYSWGKSPRTLHLQMTRVAEDVTVELLATEKLFIAKLALLPYQPDGQYALSGKSLSVLRAWLSARYNRSAFPNAFVDRMGKKGTRFGTKLAKRLEPHGHLISHVFFNLEDGAAIERHDGDPYTLGIVLVYAPGEDPEQDADDADEIADAIEEEAQKCFAGGNEIVLKNCIAISEDDLPIAQARLLMQWRLEHMTHKGDGHPGPIEA